MEVNALHVPSFSKSLLSTVYGCKQIIEPWTAKLIITKDNKIVATGTYDEETKLIKMDNDLVNAPHEETYFATKEDDWITVHRKLGHVGKDMIQKTPKAADGIKLSNRFEILPCDECLQTKVKRKSVKSQLPRPKELLEIIESSWLYYTTIPDTTANTSLDHILNFKAKIEKQTGKRIKRIRTDGGTEYMGGFLSYINAEGIIKEKGTIQENKSVHTKLY
jgi:hypothetical protein